MATKPNTKGWRVLEELAKAAKSGGIARQAVADEVGCTVQRVGEVIRENHRIISTGEKGYLITKEAWKLFKQGELQAAETVVQAQDNVVPLRAVEKTQAAVNDRLAKALEENDAEVYKRVMADPDNAHPDDFETAVAFAKAKKRRRPRRARAAAK